MISRTVTIKLQSERVDRPIALLVQVASRYESSIYLETGYKKINAKSIMGMMTMNLNAGQQVTVIATGADEEKALEGMESFLTGGNK